MHDHSLRLLVETEKAPQRVVFQGLERVVHGGLAVVLAVGDVLEEEVDLLAGDDVADVVGLGQLAEDQADHLAVDQGRAAAVARVDRGVDLDPEPADSVVVAGELDPRDDSLGDRQARTALGIAVDEHGVLDLGRSGRAARGGRLSKNDSSSSLRTARSIPGLTADHGGRQLVARLLALHEELAGVRGPRGRW